MRIVYISCNEVLCKRKIKRCKMKKSILLLLALNSAIAAKAGNLFPKDSTRIVKMKEVVVTASPKESYNFRQLPITTSSLSRKEMQSLQVNSLSTMSGVIPNLFIPDYGSKATSAIYVRGIGSRINTPSVGLYVDNIPYIDKTAFDFNFADIERLEVLRGPQSTLYGRNAMGGLIKLYTKSPFEYQGTDVKIGAGNYGSYSASLAHYHRVNDSFAFSTSGFYNHNDGFFMNTGTGKKADAMSNVGGRIRSIWLPTENLKLDLNVNYEYSDQGGYAYGMYNKTTGITSDVATNRESNYYRGLLNAGLNISYNARNFTLTSMTGFQNLKDRMFMDQDFSVKDMFTIAQKQKQNTLTQEIVFKSLANKRYEAVCGAFGFYQSQDINSPVNFEKDGIAMIQRAMDAAMINAPVKITLTDTTMPIIGSYNTPTMGAALFHQSTYNNLFFKGLSASAGLRLDYEKIKIDYDVNTVMNATMTMKNQSAPTAKALQLKNNASNDYLQLLPKFALKYDFGNKMGNVYTSVSKGYRSGGYNIQLFADIVQSQLMAKTPTSATPEDIVTLIAYKPEYTWSYEVGTHLSLLNNKLIADAAMFCMNTHDQQIVRFANSGLGRMTVNAGKSLSYGVEANIRAQITNGLSLNASYGYTHATFTDYIGNEKNQKQEVIEVDYKDKFVPMIPQNTFCLGGQYALKFKNKAFDSLVFDAQYSGVSRIYWTEKNDFSQPFYGTMNAKVGTTIRNIQLELWTRNLLNQSYNTFGFESMGMAYQQKAKPMQWGVNIQYRF